MRRQTPALIGLLGLSMTLTACGGGVGADEVAGSGDTLTVMTRWTAATPEGAAFQRAIDAFTEETGIEVEVQEGGENLDDAYETALAAGQEPDVVSVNLFDKTTGWLENDAVVEVTEYLDEWGLRDTLEQTAIDEWTTPDGRVQGFPYAGFTWPVWYNTALLEEAGVDGVPQTMDELIAAAQALRAAGIQPMAVGGSDWSGQKFVMQVVQQFASPEQTETLFREGGYCASPEAMQGLELFTQLRDAGVFVDDVQGYTAELMNTDFYTGEVAIMPAGSWAFSNAPDEMVDDIVLGGLPVPEGGTYSEPTAYRGFTGSGFWISPNGAEKIDQVEQFITSFYDEETVSDFVGSGNLVPATTIASDDAATDPLLDRALTEFPETVEFAVMPDIYVPAAVTPAVTQATALAFGAGSTPEEICAAMDQAYGG